MPSKKKKYNARFPAGRIKKIMQTDEEVGKVAQAVPIIISRTLELFVESLLTKTMHITESRHAKTLTPSHLKQCIQSESRFDFLKDVVRNIPDASAQEDNENNANYEEEDSALQVAPPPIVAVAENRIVRTPVIQYQPKAGDAVHQNGDAKVSKAEPPPLIAIATNTMPKKSSPAPASSCCDD